MSTSGTCKSERRTSNPRDRRRATRGPWGQGHHLLRRLPVALNPERFRQPCERPCQHQVRARARGERAILEIVVEQLEAHGVRDIIFCVGYLSHLIRSVFDNRANGHVNIRYVQEREANEQSSRSSSSNSRPMGSGTSSSASA